MSAENGVAALAGLEGVEPVEDPMLTPPAEDVRVPVQMGALAGARVSLIEELKQRRERLLNAKPRLTLAAPNFDGRMVIRYRAPEWIEVRNIGETWGKSKHPKAILYAQADILATCCDSVLGIDDQGEEVVLDDGLVRFLEAARLLGGEPRNDREAVFVLLSEVQVSAHHEDLSVWWSDASREVDADLAGEPSAATRI